ncbi:MAG: DMT family transporter [Candidatus Adiutrix sp.]|jgi:drug/metabolite transporter (DMT)-like permease|nr:DMT family transporter [Candidatus Adiutrix sp.]
MNGAELSSALERKLLRHARTGLYFSLISGFLWASSGTAIYLASGRAPFAYPAEAVGLTVAAALALALCHDAVAWLLVIGFNLARGKSREFGRSLRTRPGRIICLGAIMGGPMAMSCSLLGITMAGSTYAMPLTATYPALAAVLSTVFLKEKNSLLVWAGIFICIAGAVVIGYTSPEGAAVRPHFRLGIFFSVLAALGWAVEGVVSTYGMDTLDPDVVLNIRYGVSVLVQAGVVLPFLAVLGPLGGLPAWSIVGQALAEPALFLVVLAGLLGGGSFILWYRALNTIGVARVMALDICYAFWAVLLGALLTDQELTRQSLLGAAVIVVGAVLVVAHPRELISLRKV